MARKRPGKRDSDVAIPFLYFNVYTAFDMCDKFDALVDNLDGAEEAAELILLRMWKAAASHFPDGNFGAIHSRRFAAFLKWNSSKALQELQKNFNITPKKLIDILIKTRYLDKDGDDIRVHNWQRQALYRDRQYDIERKAKRGTSGTVRRESGGKEENVNNSENVNKLLTTDPGGSPAEEKEKSVSSEEIDTSDDPAGVRRESGGSPSLNEKNANEKNANEIERKEIKGETPPADADGLKTDIKTEESGRGVSVNSSSPSLGVGVPRAFRGSNFSLSAERVQTLAETCYGGSYSELREELNDIDEDMLSGELEAPRGNTFDNILSLITARKQVREDQKRFKDLREEGAE